MSRRLALLSALVVVAARGASAQANPCNINSTATSGSLSCNVATTVSMTVPSLLRMTMNGFSTASSTTLSQPSMDDYDNSTGLATVTTSGPSFAVKANRSYKVQIAADATTFSASAPTGVTAYSKPIGDVLWSTDGTTYHSLSTTAADVNTGTPTATSSNVALTYKVNYDITKDKPGAYSLGITYTLVAP
jgi:hypothetical protein